jgi:hypothetical protein
VALHKFFGILSKNYFFTGVHIGGVCASTINTRVLGLSSFIGMHLMNNVNIEGFGWYK